MTPELWVGIIVAILGSGGLGAGITAYFNRRKTKAETDSSIAQTAVTVMRETIANTIDPLNARIDQLEAELEKQKQEYEKEIADLKEEMKLMEDAIENLNGEYLKLRMACVILSNQIQRLGHEPDIDFTKIDSMSLERLKKLALRSK